MLERCGLSSSPLWENTRSTGAELAGEQNMRSKNLRSSENSDLLKTSDREVDVGIGELT